jgi:hypothetical protein
MGSMKAPNENIACVFSHTQAHNFAEVILTKEVKAKIILLYAEIHSTSGVDPSNTQATNQMKQSLWKPKLGDL